MPQDFDSEKPTKVSAKVEYYFWLTVFSFQAFLAAGFVLMKMESPIALVWIGAIASGFFAGLIYFLETVKKRRRILDEARAKPFEKR
jgi:hypothetical protein